MIFFGGDTREALWLSFAFDLYKADLFSELWHIIIPNLFKVYLNIRDNINIVQL